MPHNLTSLIKKKSHAQKEKPSGDLTDFIIIIKSGGSVKLDNTIIFWY